MNPDPVVKLAARLASKVISEDDTADAARLIEVYHAALQAEVAHPWWTGHQARDALARGRAIASGEE